MVSSLCVSSNCMGVCINDIEGPAMGIKPSTPAVLMPSMAYIGGLAVWQLFVVVTPILILLRGFRSSQPQLELSNDWMKTSCKRHTEGMVLGSWPSKSFSPVVQPSTMPTLYVSPWGRLLAEVKRCDVFLMKTELNEAPAWLISLWLISLK